MVAVLCKVRWLGVTLYKGAMVLPVWWWLWWYAVLLISCCEELGGFGCGGA